MRADPTSGDRLDLGIKLPVLAAVVGSLALLLACLAIVDRERGRSQLAALEAAFCGATVPPEALAGVDQLAATSTPDEALGKSVAAKFSGLRRGRVAAFYRNDQWLWELTQWYGARASATDQIPAALGAWGEPWPRVDCRSARVGSNLVVGRRLHTPDRHDVLLVLTQRRSEDLFD